MSSCSVLPPEIVMHDVTYIGGRLENNINASCMMILGGRTKQLDIFCRVTGFTSDFLSFIVAELIQFFNGAIQLLVQNLRCCKTHFLSLTFALIQTTSCTKKHDHLFSGISNAANNSHKHEVRFEKQLNKAVDTNLCRSIFTFIHHYIFFCCHWL